MAFEAALEKAKDMGGEVFVFSQGREKDLESGVCTALTARWMKLKLLETKAFPRAHFVAQVYDPKGRRIPAGRLTVGGLEKFKKLHKEYGLGRELDSGHAGKWVKEYLARSKKVGRGMAVGMTESRELLGHGEVACRVVEMNDSLAHLSLRASAEVDARGGTDNPLFRTAKTAENHTVGFFKPVFGPISFFDPNMGEATLKEEAFIEWWGHLMGHWSRDPMYGQYKSFRLTLIDAPEKTFELDEDSSGDDSWSNPFADDPFGDDSSSDPFADDSFG